MCCAGCASAAQWITGSGLGDYYRLRDGDSRRVAETLPDLSAWDRDDVQREHVRVIDGEMREMTLVVDGMHCAACAWLIDRALRREVGVEDVSANAVTGRVALRWRPARARLSTLLARLHRLGYRPYLAGGDALERGRRQARRRLLLRLGVAGLGAMQVMMLAEALAGFGEMMPALTFVCGSNAFVEAATVLLLELGVPFETIRTERYGGALAENAMGGVPDS